MSDVLDSNHDWKSRYFFVQGLNWVCRSDKWDSIGEEYGNTWAILDEFGDSSVVVGFIGTHFFILILCAFYFSPGVPND